MRLAIVGVLLGAALSACNSQSEATASEKTVDLMSSPRTQNSAQMDSIVIRLNQTENIMVDGNITSLDSLMIVLGKARRKKGTETKFVCAVSSKTEYAVFIQVQGIIESLVSIERNRLSKQLFERHYDNLSAQEKSSVHERIPLYIEERMLN